MWELSTKELMRLNCGVGEDSWEFLGLQEDPTSSSYRKSVLNIPWKDWCWSWNSNTLATWCKELTHLKRPWCWERLKTGGKGDERGSDGWMISPTQWTWVWVNSGSWWWKAWPLCCSPWIANSRTWLMTGLNWTEKAFLVFFPSRDPPGSCCIHSSSRALGAFIFSLSLALCLFSLLRQKATIQICIGKHMQMMYAYGSSVLTSGKQHI